MSVICLQRTPPLPWVAPIPCSLHQPEDAHAQYRIHCRCRHEKGQDIDGACGQLVVQTHKKAQAKDKSVDIEDAAGGRGKKGKGDKRVKSSNRRTELGGAVSDAGNKKGNKGRGLVNLHSVVTVASIGIFAFSALRGN